MKKLSFSGRTAPGAKAPSALMGACGAVRKTAAPCSPQRPRRGLHFSWPMLPFALALVTLASCGVKSDLTKPNGQRTPHNQPDPSQPPYPLGR